jgi:NAD(P)-dependent dehydrogenase (short-subunit alcohol dehydrogenase family)
MFAKKTVLVTLAALTVAGIGAAQAQPLHRTPMATHVAMRHEARPMVARARVMETLRLHRYVGMGEPYFLHGRYVVRSHDRTGRTVLVQLDPWTGRFIGVVRI